MPDVAWTSECGTLATRVLLSREAALCHILHELAGSVRIEGVPSEWNIAQRPVTTARLPCGHTYGVSALAVHFLANDMRCPVCRAGHTVRMRLDSVPPDLQDCFACKTSRMREDSGDETDTDTEDSSVWEISVNEIERDLRLTAEISSQDTTHVLTTTVHRDREQTHPVPDTGMRRYDIQHSFTRKLGMYIARHHLRADTCLRVYVDHPLFHSVLSSMRVALSDFAPGHVFVLGSEPAQTVGRVRHSVDDGVSRFAVYLHTDALMAICIREIQESVSAHTTRDAS